MVAQKMLLNTMKQNMKYVKHLILTVVFFWFCGISLYAQTDSFHYTEFTVNSDQDWSENSLPINENANVANGVLRIEEQLVISSGYSLSLANTVQLEFGPNGRITVQPGAELIVNGAVLTKATDAPWLGVEVLGNTSLRQTGFNQGKAYLLNGAQIEYAIKGVSLIGHNSAQENVWGTTGGVLHAEQTIFENCLQAVEFMPYHNVNEQGVPVRNQSYLNNCSIRIDDDINTVFTFGELIGISLWEVDGVVVSACDFVNDISENSLGRFSLYDGRAVVAYDASYSLRADYFGDLLSVDLDEKDFDRNSIQGFKIGVDVYGMGDLTSSCIDRTDFSNNRVGVLLRNTKLTVLSGNNFEVPLLVSETDLANDISTVGVHIKNSSRYIIEANSFIGANENGFNSDDLDAGLIIESSGVDTEDRVYGNQFDRLSYATMIYGVNGMKNDYGSSGLDIRFNDYGFNVSLGDNSLNFKDVYLHDDAFMDAVQGVISADPMEATGNRFQEKNTVNGHIDISNPDFALDYYYHQNNTSCIPENSAINNIVNSEGSYSFSQGDRSHIGYSVGNKPPPLKSPLGKFVIEGVRENYILLEDNYKEILNGGIKPEIMEVLMDDFSTSSEIYEKMVLGSPYLSDDVLMAAIHRSDKLGQWFLVELLVQNGPLSPAVMSVFEEVQPLTPYLASLVYNKDGNSQRHLLELDMKSLREELAVKEAQYLHTVLFDENLPNGYQDVYELFEEVRSPEELRIKIEALIKLEEYDMALSLLDDYQSANLDNYRAFKLIQIDLKQDGLNWFQMNSSQLESIEQLAAEETVFGAGYANAVLNLINQSAVEDYTMPIAELPEMRMSSTRSAYQKTTRSLMAMKPNPVLDDVYISYELPEVYEYALIEIHNTMGQHVAQYDLGSFKNVYKVNCETYKPGLYFVSLIVDGVMIETLPLNKM